MTLEAQLIQKPDKGFSGPQSDDSMFQNLTSKSAFVQCFQNDQQKSVNYGGLQLLQIAIS